MFVNVRQCSSMFVNVRQCSSMFVKVRQCSSRFFLLLLLLLLFFSFFLCFFPPTLTSQCHVLYAPCSLRAAQVSWLLILCCPHVILRHRQISDGRPVTSRSPSDRKIERTSRKGNGTIPNIKTNRIWSDSVPTETPKYWRTQDPTKCQVTPKRLAPAVLWRADAHLPKYPIRCGNCGIVEINC